MALDPDKFRPMVKNVARSVSTQYPSFVTAEDTEQALWLWLYAKRANVLQTVEDDPSNWESKIASTMRKVASDYCAKEKAAVEGYDTEDLYRYTIPKIRALVVDVFNYVDWQSFGSQGDGQPRAKGLANQTGDRMVELIDVKAALEELPDDTKTLLFLQYLMNYTIDNLADHFSISEEAAKKRAQRALGSLQKALGRKEPGDEPLRSQRRVVRSNAAWRASQAAVYEG